MRIVMEVMINPQGEIDHFLGLGDHLGLAAEAREKWRILLLSCSIEKVRSLPVKSWSSGISR